ncbi:Calcineurin-like phosphoesterase [Lachnospiraceae bacterium A10]|nr:Calcineurin-like phosphoesterase [Lachnospiraceae bacterium A10]
MESIIDKKLYKLWYVITFILLAVSFIWTAKYHMDDYPYFEKTNGFQIILYVCVLILYYLLYRHIKYIEKIPYPVLVCFLVFIGGLYIFLLPLDPISDPKYVVEGAINIASGDFQSVLESDYLQSVQKNINVSLLYAFFIILLPKSVLSLRVVNLLFLTLTAIIVGKISKLYGYSEKGAFFFMGTFIPLIAYLNQVYFDIPLLLLSSFAIYIYIKRKDYFGLLIALVILGFAVLLRVVGFVFIFPIIIDYVITKKEILLTYKRQTFIRSICIIALLFLIIFGVNKGIHFIFRSTNASDESIWKLFWMGINEPEFGMMHNEYLLVPQYSTIGFDDFLKTLCSRSFFQNIRLFSRKILWIWTQGTYQFQRYGFGYDGDSSSKFIYDTLLTNHFLNTSQKLPKLLIHLGRAQYMSLFTFMFLGVRKSYKKIDVLNVRALLYPMVLTFLVLIFYEMKSRYIFHLIPIMLILSFIGQEHLADSIKKPGNFILHRFKKYIVFFLIIDLIIGLSSYAVIEIYEKQNQEHLSIINTAHSLATDYGLDLQVREITIPNINREYDFIYISDLHVYASSVSEIPSWGMTKDTRLGMFTCVRNGMQSAEQLKTWIAITNNMKADGLLLGGDIIDFGDDQNINWVQNQLSILEVPYVYTLGNHDSYDYVTNSQNPDNGDLDKIFLDADKDCSYIDYGEFIVCQINSSLNCVSADTLEKFKSVYYIGKPIILISHVPLYSEDDSMLKDRVETIYNNDRLIGNGLDNVMDSDTQEFYELTTADNSPVIAVLGGHIHFQYDSMLNGWIPEYINSSAADGQGYLIRVKQ